MLPLGLIYRPDFLTPDEQADLRRDLSALEFHHDTFRNVTMKRSSAEFGFRYFANGRRIERAAPVPPFLRTVVDRCEQLGPAGTRFNQVFVTRYPPGAGIGWHVDAPVFGDTIAGISLGATAKIQFSSVKDAKQIVSLEVVGGSFYVMSGEARRLWKHRVVAAKQERISITCRFVDERQEPQPNRDVVA